MSFPSPADDYIERTLDLNSLCIKKPSATFFMRVTGDSMKGAGIYEDDILVIDRSRKAESKNIIVATIDSEFTVRRLIKSKDQIMLYPENKSLSPTKITNEMDFEIWGVVSYVIHKAV